MSQDLYRVNWCLFLGGLDSHLERDWVLSSGKTPKNRDFDTFRNSWPSSTSPSWESRNADKLSCWCFFFIPRNHLLTKGTVHCCKRGTPSKLETTGTPSQKRDSDLRFQWFLQLGEGNFLLRRGTRKQIPLLIGSLEENHRRNKGSLKGEMFVTRPRG